MEKILYLIQKESLKKFSSYAIVYDLLATGGTINCIANLIKKSRKEVCGLVTVVELMELKGRSKLNFPVVNVVALNSLGEFKNIIKRL